MVWIWFESHFDEAPKVLCLHRTVHKICVLVLARTHFPTLRSLSFFLTLSFSNNSRVMNYGRFGGGRKNACAPDPGWPLAADTTRPMSACVAPNKRIIYFCQLNNAERAGQHCLENTHAQRNAGCTHNPAVLWSTSSATTRPSHTWVMVFNLCSRAATTNPHTHTHTEWSNIFQLTSMRRLLCPHTTIWKALAERWMLQKIDR